MTNFWQFLIYLGISGYFWLFLAFSDYFCFFFFFGYFWLFLASSGHFWLFLTISGYFWLFMIIFYYFWLFLTIFAFFWLTDWPTDRPIEETAAPVLQFVESFVIWNHNRWSHILKWIAACLSGKKSHCGHCCLCSHCSAKMWLSEWVTRSPIELSWIAKNHFMEFNSKIKKG